MRSMKMYDGKIFGEEVSEYGKEHGYLDYRTLARILEDCILNNNVFMHGGYENWEVENGAEVDEDGNYYEVYQYYIISTYGARFLTRYTDELVYYHEELDMHLWGITHFGTSWDYVLTDIKLIEEDVD